METLETLQRRMATAVAVHDLVRTMKSLAAAGVRHYEQSVASLGDYEHTVELGLRALLHGAPPPPAPRRARQAGVTGTLVIGSDQGLCGTFNDQVVTKLLADLPPRPSLSGVRLFAIGGRIAARLREAGLNPEGEAALPTSAALLPARVQDLVLVVDGWHSTGNLDRVVVYHNRPAGGTASRPHRHVLLPLPAERLAEMSRQPWPTRTLPLHTAERSVLMGVLLGQHLFVSLHRALALSLVSEHASRLLAMQAAERNIDERLEDLRGRYHGHRQTAITTELLDIMTGVEALADKTA